VPDACVSRAVHSMSMTQSPSRRSSAHEPTFLQQKGCRQIPTALWYTSLQPGWSLAIQHPIIAAVFGDIP
jgi:hypothetical protein